MHEIIALQWYGIQTNYENEPVECIQKLLFEMVALVACLPISITNEALFFIESFKLMKMSIICWQIKCRISFVCQLLVCILGTNPYIQFKTVHVNWFNGVFHSSATSCKFNETDCKKKNPSATPFYGHRKNSCWNCAEIDRQQKKNRCNKKSTLISVYAIGKKRSNFKRFFYYLWGIESNRKNCVFFGLAKINWTNDRRKKKKWNEQIKLRTFGGICNFKRATKTAITMPEIGVCVVDGWWNRPRM